MNKLGIRLLKDRFKNNYLEIIFLLSVFLFLMIFFTKIHPIVLADADDWLYCCYDREPYPVWGKWNPTRLLPELFMPLFAKIGVYLLYETIGFNSIFSAISFSFALAVSLSICFMFYSLFKLFNKLNFNSKEKIFFGIFVLLCFFWIFRSGDSDNYYMLYCWDASVFFYYAIPNYLNIAFVMLYVAKDGNLNLNTISKKAIFVVFVYFCIFSNIWQSTILTVYVCFNMLLDLLEECKKHKFNLLNYIKNKWDKLLIFILWAFQHVFELNGGRSQSMSDYSSLITKIINTYGALRLLIGKINIAFIILYAMVICIYIICIVKNKEKCNIRAISTLVLYILILFAYDYMTCAYIQYSYIGRCDVNFGFIFFMIVLEIMMIDVIFRYFPITKIASLLVLCLIFFSIDTKEKTFLDPTQSISSFEANTINIDMINQIVEADKNSENETDIYVPYFNDDDNWPYADYLGKRITNFAYDYNLTSHKINVGGVISTKNKNLELNIQTD